MPPRYLPAASLPDEAFLGGRGQPHPRANAAPDDPVPALDAEAPARSATFLRSVDLFNHGYYWEAHEGWEALWHAAGREGRVAELLRALIRLAAACVKIRQGQPTGVASHVEGALDRLQGLQRQGLGRFCGIDLVALVDLARDLADDPPPPDDDRGPRVVHPRPLELALDEGEAPGGG